MTTRLRACAEGGPMPRLSCSGFSAAAAAAVFKGLEKDGREEGGGEDKAFYLFVYFIHSLI